MEHAIIGPVFQAARPNFLSLTPVCVLLGIAAALQSAGEVDAGESLLVLLAALLGHISVNLLNEYHDFRSGLDQLTTRTPMLIATYLTILAGVVASILPPPALLALLTLPAGLLLIVRVPARAEDTQRLVPYLGINVATIHVTLLLLAAGLLLG